MRKLILILGMEHEAGSPPIRVAMEKAIEPEVESSERKNDFKPRSESDSDMSSSSERQMVSVTSDNNFSRKNSVDKQAFRFSQLPMGSRSVTVAFQNSSVKFCYAVLLCVLTISSFVVKVPRSYPKVRLSKGRFQTRLAKNITRRENLLSEREVSRHILTIREILDPRQPRV